jgi:Zonular occludens toxin (Zot)
MAIYAVTGKLGSGKGKWCMVRIQQALKEGRPVATNMDIFLDKLMPAGNKSSVIRIPDKPTVADLELIGSGNATYDESLNGLIVLDELGSWLNSRTFQDKDRQPVIDWLIHSRKKGWDVIFQMQHINQIDKQVREALLEYVVRCVRLDKVKIPVVGGLIRFLTIGFHNGKLPRFHVANIRLGALPDAMKVDTDVYRADDLQAGYDTKQIFTPAYPHGAHSLLSAWHLVGRHRVKKVWWESFFRPRPPKPQLKPKLPHVAAVMALTPDRRIHVLQRLAM